MRIAEEQIDRLMLLVQKQADDIERLTTVEWREVSSFSNSWVNYGSSFYNAAYCKDAHGFVHLRGIIKDGTVDLGAFTLPTGYRPSRLVLNGVISNSSIGRVDVSSIGVVIPVTPSNSAWVQLDGITFYAGK